MCKTLIFFKGAVMPVSQSVIMQYPIPEAELTDNRLNDIVAIKDALIVLDERWSVFKTNDAIRRATFKEIISITADKWAYNINDNVVFTINTSNITNKDDIVLKLYYSEENPRPNHYVSNAGLAMVIDNVFEITYSPTRIYPGYFLFSLKATVKNYGSSSSISTDNIVTNS